MTNIKDIQESLIQEYYIKGAGELNRKLFPAIDNPLAEAIFKKAERLRLALLLVAKNADNDTKRQIVSLANDFLFQTIDLLSGNVKTLNSKDKILINILKISELLDLLFVDTYLSDTNINIIKKAFIDFVSLLEENEHYLNTKALRLSEEDFLAISPGRLDDLLRVDYPQRRTPASSAEEDIKDIKDTTRSIKDTDNKGHTIVNNNVNTARKRSLSLKDKKTIRNRRLVILDLLQSRSSMTIKDLANKLTEWSSKTIQRELQKMHEEGIINKEGSKRWTRYSIKG
jgi:predicted transcriptional regulator